VGEDTIVAIEYPVEMKSLPFNINDGRLIGLRNRRYGRTVLAIYAASPTGRTVYEARPDEFMDVGGGGEEEEEEEEEDEDDL